MLWNKLRYLLLLIAVALISVLYNNYYMGIIFLTVLILPFVLFGLLCYQFAKLKVELIPMAHIVSKGEIIPLSVQIENPTIFPISHLKIYLTYKNGYIKDRFRKEYQVSVDGRSKTSIICKLHSEYAGNLEITLKGVRIADYLKLFALKKRRKDELKIAVVPTYYELTEEYLFDHQIRLLESDHYSKRKSGDDPSEVFNIREYREGDRLQRIHWKLSRKQGQLMIKEFSDPMNCSILLLVNLCVPNRETLLFYMDAIMECALSLTYTFLRNQQMHYVAWYDVKNGGFRMIRVEQELDIYEAIDGLLQALPYLKEVDVLSSYLAEHPNDRYTDFFYVTGDVAEDNMELLSVVRADSKQLIYISDENQAYDEREITEDLLQKTKEMGINLWPVDVTTVRRDLEQVRVG